VPFIVQQAVASRVPFQWEEDQYQAELRSVIDAKIEGEEFVVKEEEAPTKVVGLMAALRKRLDSVSASKKKPARSAAARKSTRAKRKQA
jgi:non-homologous end joining protein Ku